MITPDDIRAAHARIAGRVRRTPTMTLAPETFGTPVPVAMKLEFLQVTGTFKARGAFNTLLGSPMPAAGVCAASGGNHGIAVAHAATSLGIPARIFVPEISSPAKIARIRETGAELVVGGARYSDALAACEAHAAATGALSVHAYDAWPTMAGQGTVGIEWEEDAGGLDTVLVAVGGGGLISGIARWFDRRVKVVGVEPEGSCALHAALAAGGPVDVDVQSIAADSLGARNVFARVHATAAAYVDQVVLVPDAAIREAQKRLWLGLRAASEPGGAAALAALLCGAYRPSPGERVGVLACGANVDLAALAAAVDAS
ncbi:threonine/serine dehydratase [Phreatobacter cathodiphilus]|uniref:Threonine dehydratase n=1 Tax=Phreatobacter cathodiphilus TaxID=1868589 RepID=A0A2S0NF92_9HYPH|nr:threonine/serine dehydratase [Phreatobacter cathodiphilus]AVO46849.1 threonine dehydratase [Phreatobacter cathodiphilus]